MERLYRSKRTRRGTQQQPGATRVDPAQLKKRVVSLCAYTAVAGEYVGIAAAIRGESRGLLEPRRDEAGVRYHVKKLVGQVRRKEPTQRREEWSICRF